MFQTCRMPIRPCEAMWRSGENQNPTSRGNWGWSVVGGLRSRHDVPMRGRGMPRRTDLGGDVDDPIVQVVRVDDAHPWSCMN